MFHGARDGDLELPDGEKAVIFDMVEVDVFDGGALGSVFPVLVDGREVDEQIGKLMVLLDEGGGGECLEPGDEFSDLIFFEPGVYGGKGFPEFQLYNDFPEGFPVGVGRELVFIEGEDGPPEFRELVVERDFDVGLFVPVHDSQGFPE